MKKQSSVIRQLQVIFLISTLILLVSSVASYTTIQRLISSTGWVSHTYQVLLRSEEMLSQVKDGETSQRGYIITGNNDFLKLYEESYPKAKAICADIKELTSDNPVQQVNIEQARKLINKRFHLLANVITAAKKNIATKGTPMLEDNSDLITGRETMMELRDIVDVIKKEEIRLLDLRNSQLSRYTTYAPILVLVAALIAIIITILSYVRIKRDLDERQAKQLQEEAKYIETNRRISVLESVTGQLAEGNYNTRSEDIAKDELGRIGIALNEMAVALEKNFKELSRKNWLQTGAVKINDAIRGQAKLEDLAGSILNCLADYIDVPVATLYVSKDENHFSLTGSYAAAGATPEITVGQGLAGQAAKSRHITTLNNLSGGYLNVSSSIGKTQPLHLVIIPLLFSNETIGLIELGFLHEPNAIELELLENTRETMASAVNTAVNVKKLQELFEETQAQAEELQSQHTELESVNAELEAQAQNLQASEEELKVQQEELQQTNLELEEKTRLLEERNQLIIQRNEEVQKKAEELALSAKYKSEFLANMSHELRTPLNSILLLSRLLGENTAKNLNTDQVEYAKVIQSSGNGLLSLIDEILDLSKIEAGKMQLEFENVVLEDVAGGIRSLFEPIAKEKKLDFYVKIEKGVAGTLKTDRMRLEQIIKNLLSNALKFTAHGSVGLAIHPAGTNNEFVQFSVKDTGIGIPKDKQHLIFEAFQQADGSTRRKFGGTGLGLSISRELARLLGGEIKLVSEENAGSEFTLYVPVQPMETAEKKKEETTVKEEETAEKQEPAPKQKTYSTQVIPESLADDRKSISPKERSILIIEDDVAFAKALIDFSKEKGYKVLSAVRGDEGIELAQKFMPTGILLDIELPVKNGWEVMEELKTNPLTRHIPVHIMSSHKVKRESLMKGAVDFIDKPVAFEQMNDIFKKIEFVLGKKSKKVLIVEENPKHAKALAYFLETFSVSSEIKNSVPDSVNALKKQEVDCVILDMGVPDQHAYETLETVKKNPGMENLPIIIFTGKSLSRNEEQRIKQYADSIVVKTAHSYQRILDEVSLFLHLVEENRQPSPSENMRKLGGMSEVLANKTVLIVDDDVRNIFSLSKALEAFKMNVITAVDGKEALAQLEKSPSVDVVLMDMMMPELDGYQTTSRIRAEKKWQRLPVIAVTAKAMTGDRERCINAGASDYITKPVDIDQLVSLLRVWLYDKA